MAVFLCPFRRSPFTSIGDLQGVSRLSRQVSRAERGKIKMYEHLHTQMAYVLYQTDQSSQTV